MITPELQMFGEFPEEARLVSNRELIGDLRAPVPGRRPPVGSRFRRLDAVVVPSSRGVMSLGAAATTAALTGSWLVVLCSRDTKAGDVELVYGQPAAGLGSRVLAVDVGPSDELVAVPWPSLTAGHVASQDRDNDVSVKRNLALRIARRAGWATMMFMDDDVEALSADDLHHALSLLAGLDRGGRPRSAVGFAFDDFRDDSVVGHAAALVGSRHQTFIGAGTMLLRVDADLSYFPRVYNEDWLFLLELIRRDPESVALAGLGRQEAFDPFARDGDVERQEFGDVLAEGLYRARHRGCLGQMAEPGAWRRELATRRAIVAESLARLATLDQARPQVSGAIAALGELRSMQDRRQPWPERLAAFTRAWQRDCQTARVVGRRDLRAARLGITVRDVPAAPRPVPRPVPRPALRPVPTRTALQAPVGDLSPIF